MEDLFIAVPSIVLGAKSLYDNVKSGNIRGAIVDGAGIVADVGAAALPGVPGGAGLAIKAARATVSVAQKVEKVGMVVDGVEATVSAAQSGDGLGVVSGVGSTVLGAKSGAPGVKSAKTTQAETSALAKAEAPQAEKLPTSLSPNSINFSQRTVSSNVAQYADDMVAGRWDWSRSGPLRVMEKEGGGWVSYDNRRLLAAQQAGLDSVPVQVVRGGDMMTPSRTWAEAFTRRFNDPRNVPAVPAGGLPTQPTIAPPRR